MAEEPAVHEPPTADGNPVQQRKFTPEEETISYLFSKGAQDKRTRECVDLLLRNHPDFGRSSHQIRLDPKSPQPKAKPKPPDKPPSEEDQFKAELNKVDCDIR